MAERACKNCEFVVSVLEREYKHDEKNFPLGEIDSEWTEYFCHRNPPQVTVLPLDHNNRRQKITAWPRVDANDWCGEFKPLPDTPTPGGGTPVA